MGDSRKRSLTKSLTFRVTGIILLGIISYLVTGSWIESGWISLVFNAIRVPFYFGHERWWERIAWGRQEDPQERGVINDN